MKRALVTTAAIVLAWTAVDALAHGLVLAPLYRANAALWRPLADMNAGLVMAVRGILAIVFVATYQRLVQPRTLVAGLKLGALLGVALGTSAGLGTYIHSPIPLTLALGWLALGIAKGVLAGALLGALARERQPA